ncbi:exodeoxyribonuclease VII large subunit [Parapedobacter lycopersici]|uniref:exodeoxyribonuclease VII large subunit n=1 Tax=Parapedobacter lycopersici TaxID=1864939 RepID=UPI00214D6A71|nr:exodeoxyribonuclease VII large subunit [Parapedobacter lycopersici]
MPEKLPDKTVFSLAEVARSIQRTLAERYKRAYWIKAEMNKLNHYSHSGHCYPELVEKKDGQVVAEMRSILWKGDYQRINQRFLEIAREPLKDGITILIHATITYDPLHGLGLRILDIDPAYSLGELEREKMASISRLKQEGIFAANKQRPFPLVPKRLAVISVETSKGYADFLNIINGNPWGYRLEYTLFPALLQGDKSIASIIGQLRNIASQPSRFDVVTIIRGGGGDVGLSSYNHYLLASAIATFPIPVLTGIGHSTNETVSEMVAYRNAITPSELADFLIQQFHRFATPVMQAQQVIANRSSQLLADHRHGLGNVARYFRMGSLHLIQHQHRALGYITDQLQKTASGYLTLQHRELQLVHPALAAGSRSTLKDHLAQVSVAEKTVRLLDPQQVLNRGYSITRVNGRALKTTDSVNRGDTVETVLASGKFTSTIDEIQND